MIAFALAFFIIVFFFLFAGIFLFMMITEWIARFQTGGIPYVPTTREDVAAIVSHMGINASDCVIDLGSGDGRVPIILERISGCRAIGYERGLWLHLWAKIQARWHRAHARFFCGDFFKYSWAEATVIYCYLLPFVLPRVWEKAHIECRPGTRIVSRDFLFPGLTPSYTFNHGRHRFFIYQI